MSEPNPTSEIERECADAGLDIVQVLSKAGIAYSTWWRWKDGRFEPRPATLRRLRAVIQASSQEAA